MPRIHSLALSAIVCLAAAAAHAQEVAATDDDPFAEALAGAESADKPAGPEVTAVYVETPAQAAARQKITAALDTVVPLEFVDAPLHDVLSFIEDAASIEIEIDQTALDDAGVTTDTPINRSLKGITLRSSLDLMLGELELTWMIADEVLLITSREKAETELVTVIYPVADLLERGKDGQFEYDPLLEMITATIQPSAWDETGGPGSIKPLRGTLVVSQTQDVHDFVQLLLSAVRRASGP